MVPTPATADELAAQLAQAFRAETKISALKLSRLNRVVEHKPEDMTATVEAGMPFGAFQEVLAGANQWLPVDPPLAKDILMGDLLAFNHSGPRRFGFGTIRDYLIGIKVALADGTIVKAGGKVVKNVAGYDLCKLFIGAKHSLGIILEATFKLRPRPEAELVLERRFSRLADLEQCARALLDSSLAPVIMDAWREKSELVLVAGFAGTREDIEWQRDSVQQFGLVTESSTEYDDRFAREHPNAAKCSVLPSLISREIEKLQGAPFVARFGNGTLYSPAARPQREMPNPELQRRVKDTYDPRHILPELIQ